MHLFIYMYVFIYKAENCTLQSLHWHIQNSTYPPSIYKYVINLSTLLSIWFLILFPEFFSIQSQHEILIIFSLTFSYSNKRWTEINVGFGRKLCCSQSF